MATAEIKNGRLAMIAITAFAAQEFVTHIAIVDQSPLFFKPIWQVLSDFSQNVNLPPTDVVVDAPPSAVVEAVTTQTAPLDAAIEAAKALQSSSVDAVPAAPPADVVSEAASSAVVSPPPVAAVSPVVDDAELVAAKKRIAEL